MRKLLTTVSIGAVVLCGGSMAVAQDGGETVSRAYDVAGFEEISVVGPHHVVVSVGPAFSIRAEGPQQTFEDTEVEVQDGRLKIHPVDDDRWEWRDRERRDFWQNYRPATFHITLPRLESVSLVGGGDMRVDRVEGETFSASVAGSGGLDLAALQVDVARFSIAGSGDLVARGSAGRSRVSVAGSGNLRAGAVHSNDASISVVGSGNVELTVENDARVSIVGSGDVDIAGPATCSVSRMGSGDVRCNGQDVGG